MQIKKGLMLRKSIVSVLTVIFMVQIMVVPVHASYNYEYINPDEFDNYEDYENYYNNYLKDLWSDDEEDETDASKASKLDNPVKNLTAAEFSNNNILIESDRTTGWDGNVGGDDISKSLGQNEFKCSFYVDEEIVISDLYFSTNYTGIVTNYTDMWNPTPEIVPIPANLKIVIEKYENSGSRTQTAIIPAKVYTCPEINPLVYNTFKQLTGASDVKVALKKGVYMARITPQDASFDLIGRERKSDDPYDTLYNMGSVDYGVVMTGGFTGGGVALFRNYDATWGGITPIIQGANAGKSISEISDDMVKEINKQLELRKKEQEAAQKAAAEKAAKEAAEAAKKPITLKINGKVVKTDSAPVIEDGRTLVPVRAIVEELGYIVSWNSTTQIIDVYDIDGELRISMKLGSKKASVATGIYGVMDEKTLDVSAKSIGGRTMVPARFIAETLGCEVKWDQTTKTVTITSNQG